MIDQSDPVSTALGVHPVNSFCCVAVLANHKRGDENKKTGTCFSESLFFILSPPPIYRCIQFAKKCDDIAQLKYPEIPSLMESWKEMVKKQWRVD